MSRVEEVVLGVILLVMTLFIALCALAISPWLWIAVALLVRANLIHWGLT
jgi:hypothetical protein